jgi:hypothetical protein
MFVVAQLKTLPITPQVNATMTAIDRMTRAEIDLKLNIGCVLPDRFARRSVWKMH